jgi:23S rRNA pseudouridine1911/1915/1917 synthase
MTPIIIYEDRQLLIVVKPPGWLAQADGGNRPDLLGWVKKHIEQTRQIPTAYAGLCHRLDMPVGGLMVLAKTSKTASRLSHQFRNRSTGKIYLAMVSGRVTAPLELNSELVRDGRLTRLAGQGEVGKEASLSFRVRSLGKVENQAASLLEVTLKTGFKHQIRSQLAAIGYPIWGDSLYGGPQGLGEAIGLFAFRLIFEHPVEHTKMTFVARPGMYWPWTAFSPDPGQSPL